MSRTLLVSVAVLALPTLTVLSCASPDAESPGPGGGSSGRGGSSSNAGGSAGTANGGAFASGGSGATAGMPSAGSGGSTAANGGGAGVSAGAGNPGGAGSGGATGNTGGAGQSGMAGTLAGGAGASGAGGSPAGGGPSGGAGGGAGGTREVKPSVGCERGSTDVTIPNSLIGLPPDYNGTDPVPAVIAFHAAGNDNTSMERTFRDSDLADKYFMVYPNSSGNGWNMSADKNRYLDAYAALLSQACVDENRVYATGHSSGAQMVVQLLCSGDAEFDAVAPVASSVYCNEWEKGPVPALIIHGVQDVEREAYGLNDGNGEKDLQPYLTSNMCQEMSTPFDPDLGNCGNVNDGVDGNPFDDGCVEFSGCSVPTRWCNHNDPQYGTSNHGIPCFGVRAIFDFFESLG
jgi:polyhydroxybutyrate depolymerase